MGQIVGIALACLAGRFTWGMAGALSGGAYPFGSAGKLEALLFFAPLLGVALPLALGAFSQSIALGLWVVALAPLLGGINFLLFVLFSGKPTASGSEAWPPALILSALWLIPLIGSLFSVLSRAAATGAKSMQVVPTTEHRLPPNAPFSGIAGPYVKVLADRGYDVRIEGSERWRVVAPGSSVIQHVRSLEELQTLASSSVSSREA